MDTAKLLLALKQDTRSLESYILEYLEIANYSDLPDCVLIDFFCEGINQPLKSRLTLEGPRSSLSDFMDYALLTVGSAFTVGVAEECDIALNCVIAATPEHTHKMAAIAEPVHKMAATTTPCLVIAASHESIQVTADLKEQSQVAADLKDLSKGTVDVYEPSQVPVDVKKPSQIIVDHRESSQVTVDHHESSHFLADRHEASYVSADPPESLHVSADPPESLHVSTDPSESLHVSADLPESLHVSVHPPESLQDSAHPPESLHVTVDHPESCHVLSITPRYSRSVLRFPSLVSSVRDAPLVSARAAGIPRSTHFNPSVPELFPLSEALPMMGIALSSQVKSSLLYCQFFHMYSTYIQRIEIALLSDPWCIQLTLTVDVQIQINTV